MPNQVFEPDEQLTAIAIGYHNKSEEYIADEVLPYISVESEKFDYNEFPIEEGFSVPDTKVGRTSKPKQVEFSAEQKTARVEDHALDAPVPNYDKTRAPKNYDPEGRATEGVTDLLKLDRELRVAKLMADPASYALKKTLSGSDMFDNDGSDPIKLILTARDKMLVDPNALVLGLDVWTKLRLNPAVVKATHGNSGDKGVASRQAVAELLEIPQLIIGKSRYNIARPGQKPQIIRAYSNICSLLHINPNADSNQGVTFGFTARFGDKVAGRIFDPDMGMRGGYKIRVGESVKELIVAPDCGYLFENVINGG